MKEELGVPFGVVVLTFPDARAASAASRGPLWGDLSRRYPDVAFLATADPFGCRVGSGGGTLAAIAEVTEWRQLDPANNPSSSSSSSSSSSNILILHAGGQSSRCPTQMCFGKAWTTFPTATGLVTPIHIWLDFMFRQFIALPKGSIAVIAADTMLRIPPSGSSQNNLHGDSRSVVVLTVPAPLRTATNHGVFIMHKDNSTYKSGQLSTCQQVLQKPSLSTLRKFAATTTTTTTTNNNNNNNNNNSDQAWIDTGVLLFLPRAAQALQRLATQESSLYGCTRSGLERLYQQGSSSEEDMTTFTSKNCISIDLYTHILQVLKITDQSMTWEAYREKFPDLPEATARSLYDSLSPLSMKLWAEPLGRFLHLGTTVELMDFYMSVASDSKTDHHAPVTRSFALDLGLTSRRQVIVSTHNRIPPVCARDCVMYHSILQASDHLSIEKHSLVEFCEIECSNLRIGDNCWVSGLRGKCSDDVIIPNNLIVQELALTEQTHVYMVLGVDDPIKSASMLYGRPWNEVTSRLGLVGSDIWDCDTHTLWNAKLHPVIMPSDEGLCFSSSFGWLSRLDDSELSSDTSLQAWLKRPRLSLADIRQQADASLEYSYRERLSTYGIPSARTMLYSQMFNKLPSQIVELPFKHNNTHEMMRDSWRIMYGHMLVWVSNDMYDVLGATAMRYASSLQAIGTLGGDLSLPDGVKKEEPSTIDSFQNVSGKHLKDELTIALNTINSKLSLSSPEKTLNNDECKILASILLAISATCTRICVGGDARDDLISAKPSTCLDQWVVATAPARIDIAGGWSDTPPICYEHGSEGTLISFCVCP